MEVGLEVACVFFFFQAEAGIRDLTVTGVQTCALPIFIQLTRQIAVEYGRDGVICNGVAPGKVVTGTPGDLSQSEATAAYVRSRTPFARFGEPGDVAAAVAFLASDDATYISGATLMVDGGWMAY